MQKILVTMMAFALTIAAQGQEAIDIAQFVAVYDYECRTQNDEGTPVTDRMQLAVQVGRTMTKSMPRSWYKRKDLRSREEFALDYQEALMHMPTIWINWPEGQTTVREWIFPNDFEGSEATPEIAWTLTDDTLTIGGYYCQTATCKFRGVEWRVCYTEEIPSSVGPWRLRGLPGLIVKAESEAHTFCIAEIIQESTPIMAPEKKPDVQRMAYAKLQKYRNGIYTNRQYAKSPFYYVTNLQETVTGAFGLYHDGQLQLFSNGERPLLTKAHVYHPLEVCE